MKSVMLKFVSTKPPRGRSPSGSQTPERDVTHRQFEPPPRAHTSPRVHKKHYPSSQSHTYPTSRAGHTSAASSITSSYRQIRSPQRSYSPVPPSHATYQSDSFTNFAPFIYSDKSQHQSNIQSQQQQQHYQHQYQQYQQPAWPHHNVQNSYKRETPNASSNVLSEVSGRPASDSRLPGRAQSPYSVHNKTDTAVLTQTHPSFSSSPTSFTTGSEFRTGKEPVRYGSIKITQQIVGDGRLNRSSHTRSSSDYDLAKAIPVLEDSNERTQHTLPRTTQYIINESLTKKRTSTTYIPPPGSGLKPVTVQEVITDHPPRDSSSSYRQVEYAPATSRAEQPRPRGFQSRPARTEQVMTTCVPQITSTSSNDAMNKIQSSNRPIGMSSQTHSTSTMKDMLNKSQEQGLVEGIFTLDVVHITDRIKALTFLSEGHDSSYSLSLKEVVRMLKTKYGDHYMVLNVSEKNEELAKALPQVKEFGWPDHLAPPLERLCTLCKALDSWLSADVRNVVILHCKGGCRRVASIIAAYVQYNNICASADQSVGSVAMKRFYDEKLADLPLPSQRRYVNYFSGLLSGTIKINSNPIYLHHILIHGVPNFDTKGGCQPYIKIYQSMEPIFTSGVYNVTDNMQKVCISITPGIPLRGDILIKCYHKRAKTGQREVMWQCQFHTCAVSGNKLIFSKQELDDALLDPRFPETGKVEFVFGPSSDVLVSVSGFKSDVTVPVVENEESLVRTDSYENFNKVQETVDVDFKKNGISSSQVLVDRTPVPKQTLDIDHRQAPDGSLYATVTKKDPLPSSQVSVNGPVLIRNGPVTSSSDSGYPGQNSGFQSHYTLSASTGKTVNTDTVGAPSSSEIQQTNQSSSTLSRKTVQTVEERTQLDELLNNLLSDQAYVSPAAQSSKSLHTPAHSQPAPGGTSTTITLSPTMNNAKTVTTTTRTFTSYSTTDAHRNPDQVLIQRSELSYKVPEQADVKDHYRDDVNATSSKSGQAYNPKGVPGNAFSYTSGQFSSQRAEFSEREQGLHSTASSQQTYHPEPTFDNTSTSYPYSSLDGETNSWLAQQQQKLKNFREGRDSSGHTEQEKKLVNELQFAQNKYYTHSSQTEVDDRAALGAPYNRQQLQNGPVSPGQIVLTNGATQKSPADGTWSQDQFYNTSYSTSSYTESRSYGDKQISKPPPSPVAQRLLPPSSAPLPVPARSSSREYMRTRSNSSSSGWQQQPQQHRPLQRQQSETLYDKSQDGEPVYPRSYGSAHSTPPQSPPRAISPSGPRSTTTYTTYRTLDKQREAYDEMQRANKVQQQQQVQLPQQPPQQVSHHYVTEVFVHRSDQNKDSTDSSTRLDELERNLEAASQSIMSSQQHVVRQIPPQQVTEESVVTHSSQQYRTYQESKPEPPRVKEIEEDQIILRPIGPGMQTLEPESVHTGTLGRPTTPGFPTGPGGGTHIISPTGTLQQQQQQQQHQTVQYQQYQSQQFQNQSSHHDGTLHIDTSNKMISASHSPSAGSPHSPSSFNTLRQQLTAGSVGSLGPHSVTGQSSPSVYFGLSRRGSVSSLTDTDTVHATPKFVKDTSKYWYKPNITRDEAIQMLKDKQPGTFVIRDSNSFPGAYGLALKVATIPPNVQAKPSGDPQADLVRHFLIEPTPKGVRLRGCSNEPVFGSLAALVYQHSITALALPTKLTLPQPDTIDGVIVSESSASTTESSAASTLLVQGAACNVIYINSVDLESLTGPQAIAKAVKMSFENLTPGQTTVVHFKVFDQGITLTDNNRKLFFRRHYPVSVVTYCGIDPQDRRWKREIDAPGGQGDARIFGFVARKNGSANENTCHIFAELDPEQPASAIVNFVTKVMIGQSKVKS